MTTAQAAAVMAPVAGAANDDLEFVLTGPVPAAAAPSGPAVRLRITVMARPSLLRFGLCCFASQAALALALAVWLGDARLPGAAAANLALAAAYWWYLHYPVGVYEPATNSYVEIGPFGLWLRRRPATAGQTLALRGDRIVTTGRWPHTVLHAALVRPGEWASIARCVRKAPDRPIAAPAEVERPGYLTRRHRAAGIALAALAVGGLLHSGTAAAIMSFDDDVQAAGARSAAAVTEGR